MNELNAPRKPFVATPEQARVLESMGRGLAVQAGAGSGKTTTMVQKCLRLIEVKPDARFAAVSFTERSTSDLREKLAAQLPEHSPLHRHTVTTIHGFCASILREFPRLAGCDGEESLLSEAEAQLLWERALDGLWQEHLPDAVKLASDRLLARESRTDLVALLKRTQDLALFGALKSLAAPDQTDDAQALSVLSAYVLDRYQGLKKRRGVLDFNDLERSAFQILKDPGVQRILQSRYELLIVDEFQDTNPTQAEIIWSIARADHSNLCVVGDPKQSIYRFRDADVSVFESLCAQLPERASLSRNFRSDPRILDWVNEVCTPAFQALEMNYEPLTPGLEANPAIAAAIERVEAKTPKDLARFLKAQNAAGVEWGEMAMLVRQVRAQGAKWIRALVDEGIPIALGSGGLFWEDPRVREMAALIQWWDRKENTIAGGAFLLAPWVGVSPDQLDQWLLQDPTLVQPFYSSDLPLARLLKPLREGPSLRPGELILALLDHPAAEAELGVQALGLWHRLEEWSSRGLGFHAVALELRRCLDENRREREVPPPAGKGVLQILTIHGSKGLEFERVILVDFPPKPPRAKSAPLLYWDRERGAYLGGRDSDGDRMGDEAPESEWKALEARKNLAESMRLLYVALTRAKRQVWIAWEELPEVPEKPGARPKKQPASIYDREDWRAWVTPFLERVPLVPAPAGAGQKRVSGSDAPVANAQRLDRLKEVPLWRPRSSVTDWNTFSQCPRRLSFQWFHPEWTSSVAALLQDTEKDTEGFELMRTAEKDPAEAGAVADPAVEQRTIGTEVHRCLELGDEAGLHALEAQVGSDRFLAEPVIEWARTSPAMRPSGANRSVYPELAFEVPVGPHILVGSMDRLVRDEGRYAIIDFKVTAFEKTPEKLLSSYSAQLELYAYALRALAPDAESVEARLVAFSHGKVTEVPVPLDGYVERVEERAWALEAMLLAQKGEPKPASHCRHCPYLLRCPEGQAQVSRVRN